MVLWADWGTRKEILFFLLGSNQPRKQFGKDQVARTVLIPSWSRWLVRQSGTPSCLQHSVSDKATARTWRVVEDGETGMGISTADSCVMILTWRGRMI